MTKKIIKSRKEIKLKKLLKIVQAKKLTFKIFFVQIGIESLK